MLKKTPGLLLLLLFTAAAAQQKYVDSLIKVLEKPMSDSDRAMTMMRLAVNYEAVDTAKAYQAYQDAIQFAAEKKLYYQLGRVYQNRSFLLKTANHYEEAIRGIDTAIEYYKKSNHPRVLQWEASAYNDKAGYLKVQNRVQEAIELYIKSIALLEENNLTQGLTNKYANLSSVFGDLGEYEKQVEYANKAVEMARRDGMRQDRFIAFFILANGYNNLNNMPEAKRALDSSRIYYNEAENEDNIDILVTYYLISAQVFRQMAQYDSAMHFFQKTYDVSKTYNYGFGQAESQLQMGAVSILRKRYADAEQYLAKGIKEAEALNYYGMLDMGYKYMADVYEVTGRYKEAYVYHQKYKEVSDSLVNVENKKYAQELEKKYETAKKDAQLLVQQAAITKKNTLNYILIGGTVLILLISALLYRNYRQKQKLQQQRINELETEKHMTAMEAVLKGEEQERTRLAKDLHDGLGGMMSGIKYSFQTMKRDLIMTPENQQAFERSMDMLDSSISELRRVAHNMMPEALVKFGLDTALKDFCNDINNSGHLQVNYQSIGLNNAGYDQTQSITIYRIVQELLNNIMKHAAAKTAIVQVSKINDVTTITVEDDGKGFDTKILEGTRGIGWSNIESRIQYLKGKTDIRSEAGKGTSVHIEINA